MSVGFSRKTGTKITEVAWLLYKKAFAVEFCAMQIGRGKHRIVLRMSLFELTFAIISDLDDSLISRIVIFNGTFKNFRNFQLLSFEELSGRSSKSSKMFFIDVFRFNERFSRWGSVLKSIPDRIYCCYMFKTSILRWDIYKTSART